MKKNFFIITVFFILLYLLIFCHSVFSYQDDITYELPVSAVENGPKRSTKTNDNFTSYNTDHNISLNVTQKPEEIELPYYIEKYSDQEELSKDEAETTILFEYSYGNKTRMSDTEDIIEVYSGDSEKNQSVNTNSGIDDDFISDGQLSTAVVPEHNLETNPEENILADYTANTDIFSVNEEQINTAEPNISYLSEKEFIAILQGKGPYQVEEELLDAGDGVEEYINTSIDTEYNAEINPENKLFSDISIDGSNFSGEKNLIDVTENNDDYISGIKPEDMIAPTEDFSYNDETATTRIEAIETYSAEYEVNEPLIDNALVIEPVMGFEEITGEQQEDIPLIRRDIAIPAPFDMNSENINSQQNLDIDKNLFAATVNNNVSAKNKEDDKTENSDVPAYLSFMKSGGGIVKNIHIIAKKNELMAEVLIDGRPSGGMVEYFYINPPEPGIAFDLYGTWEKSIPDRIPFRSNIFSYIDAELHEDRIRLIFRSTKASNHAHATVETETLPGIIRIYINRQASTY